MRIEPDELLEVPDEVRYRGFDAVVRGWPFARPSWLGEASYQSGDEMEFAETPMEVSDCDLVFDDDITIVDDRGPVFSPPAQPAIWSPTA